MDTQFDPIWLDNFMENITKDNDKKRIKLYSCFVSIRKRFLTELELIKITVTSSAPPSGTSLNEFKIL